MAIRIQMQLNEKLFLRDPQDTRLGRSIIKYSIVLIHELGFERFTFKKLAERIESTEASIYRYFENKHLLLLYLLGWYWEWTRFQLDFNTNNIDDPKEKLRIAIATIVNTSKRNDTIDFVDEDLLHDVVVVEGVKGYHSKEVDKENKDGFFATYKALAGTIAGFIREINPQFTYPASLASTLLEMAKDQTYFAEHLPRLSDVKIENGDLSQVEALLMDFAFRLIAPEEYVPTPSE
ncbi:MAG: helix-turn-helix domain-containing protein [Saprospiraceae bacterium]